MPSVSIKCRECLAVKFQRPKDDLDDGEMVQFIDKFIDGAIELGWDKPDGLWLCPQCMRRRDPAAFDEAVRRRMQSSGAAGNPEPPVEH